MFKKKNKKTEIVETPDVEKEYILVTFEKEPYFKRRNDHVSRDTFNGNWCYTYDYDIGYRYDEHLYFATEEELIEYVKKHGECNIKHVSENVKVDIKHIVEIGEENV